MTLQSPGNQPPPGRIREWPGWKPLLVSLSLCAALVAILWWTHRDDSQPVATASPGSRPLRPLPVPSAALEDSVPAATVAREYLDGVPVLCIRAADEGDEMLVEIATGKLIAVRDSQGRITHWPRMPGATMSMTNDS